MYTTDGKVLVLSLEDLDDFQTLFEFLTCGSHSKAVGLLTARNICRAVAELHQIGVVHGDLSSENILIRPALGSDVKLIDFDMARLNGTSTYPGGNPDFTHPKIEEAMRTGLKIKASFSNDLYSLGICCYLVLERNDKKYYESLEQVQLPVEERERLINTA